MSSEPMSQLHRKVLEKRGPDLLQDLDTDDVNLELLAEGVLTRDDVEKIDSGKTRREKVTLLLDILPRRGSQAFPSFVNILFRLEGSKHLGKVLNETELDLMQPIGASGNIAQVTQDCPDGISIMKQMSFEQLGDCKPAAEPDSRPVTKPEYRPAAQLHSRPAEADNRGRGPKNPSITLKELHLMDLAGGLGQHWETLAIKLGMKKADIFQCKEDNRFNNKQQVFDMLTKWRSRNGRKATVGVLLQACKEIEDLEEEAYAFLYDL